MTRKWNELLALFLAGFATLLLEITLTRIFAFSVWSNYAYLVISTAMFGLGLSGVILTRWPNLLELGDRLYLTSSAAVSGVTMLSALWIINAVPIHLPTAPNG